ncbi:MAG: hypothetical protein HYV32_02535 [Candidatus Kerfeldbacteria bacterium]|nr:hypothetical protein [Candidatus Kerfeldbacteria bacterium]
MFKIDQILQLLSSVSLFLLGFFVLKQNYKNPTNITFFLIGSSLSLWSMCIAMFTIAPDYKLFNKLVFAGPFAFPALFVLFSYYFPIRQLNKKWLFYFLSSVAIIFTTTWPFSVSFSESGERIESWLITILFPLYFFTFIFWGFAKLIKSYIKFQGLIRRQVQYFFIGLLITVIIASTTNLIFPIFFNDRSFNGIGPLATIVFLGFTSYAIIRYRLMDIRTVLTRSLVYALLISIVMSTFGLITFLSSTYFSENSRIGQIGVLAITSLIIVTLLDPIKRFIAKATNKIFFKAAINYPQVTKNLTDVINEEVELGKLIEHFSLALEQQLRLEHVILLLPVGNNTFISPEELDHSDQHTKNKIDIYNNSILIQYLIKSKKILILDELDRKVADAKTKEERKKFDTIRDNIENMKAYAIVPIAVGDKLDAILVLSRKRSGDTFSINDIQLLEVIAPQMASGIQKARLYQEAKEFTVKLEREVERATSELKHANEKLTELDQAKSEFMSIASHQLRTPLAGIIGYLSMIKDGDYGVLDKEKTPVISDVLDASQRLSRLVNTFLNVTRIEAGRFVMNFTTAPFDQVIEAMYKELKPTADKKQVKLIYKKTALPEAEVDVDKIKDVILNLVDNAIKYTPQGSVTISAEANSKKIHVRVADTGVGIANGEAKNLFNKFVRGSEIARVNPNGSGLGLFIAKKIVEGHGGKIWAESPGESKGTTFHFEIPIVADSAAKQKAKEFQDRAKGVATPIAPDTVTPAKKTPTKKKKK